jgi:DNA primase
MAKTYLDIVKYMVEAKFSINGNVDKPDIIGAVFGQTEGLLGDDLDLRELQKGGKIGRIEIELSQSNNRCVGKLLLPASLDRIETCILAAAVESVDRVGPYEAQFSVEKVEDTRSEKRRKILSRAKDLVKLLLNTEIPDSKELSEMVQSEVRVSEITSFGPEKLPSGPEVGKSPELVVVEGRADVLNLLKNDVASVIAVGGATAVPKSIINLCREKEVTVFLDGDRGGDLILRNLTSACDIDYVARAPDGKEVEDLTRKEIIKAMRTRVPLDQYRPGLRGRQHMPQDRMQHQQPFHEMQQSGAPDKQPDYAVQDNNPSTEAQVQNADPSDETHDNSSQQRSVLDSDDDSLQTMESEPVRTQRVAAPQKPAVESMVLSELVTGLDALSGTLRSRLYDNSGTVIKEVPIRDLLSSVQSSSNVYGIVLDGVITQRLVELALQKGVRAIYGLRANPMQRKHTDIILYTKDGSV